MQGDICWIPVSKLRPDPDAIMQHSDAEQQRLYGVIDALDVYQPIVVNGHLDKIIWGEEILEALIQRGEDKALCLVVDLDEIEHAAASIALRQQYGRVKREALENRVLWLEKEGFDTDYTGIPIPTLERIRGEREPIKRKPKVCPKCGSVMEPEHDHA